jgi:hypothetical protein
MEQAHEEEIMRITAEFMAEQEAGHKPRLEEYARRYPQYVDEMADFVTYYYAVEAGLPTDTTSVPSLSAGSRAALDLAWERATEPLACHALTLAVLARRRRYTLARLAAALDLSDDIVVQLARRLVEPETIPREILLRLSRVLSQSLNVVRQALGLPEVPSTPLPAGKPAVCSGLPSFREALVASLRLSVAQKERWLAVLEREGL